MIGSNRVTGSNGNWHESLISEGPPPSSSDRSFGFLFAAVCAAIAVFAIWEGRRSALWWAIAASVFCVVALLAAPVLGPLNRAWRWLSLQLFKIVQPDHNGCRVFRRADPNRDHDAVRRQGSAAASFRASEAELLARSNLVERTADLDDRPVLRNYARFCLGTVEVPPRP